MCFGRSTLGAVAKTRLESRIKKFTPHYMGRPCGAHGTLNGDATAARRWHGHWHGLFDADATWQASNRSYFHAPWPYRHQFHDNQDSVHAEDTQTCPQNQRLGECRNREASVSQKPGWFGPRVLSHVQWGCLRWQASSRVQSSNLPACLIQHWPRSHMVSVLFFILFFGVAPSFFWNPFTLSTDLG